MNNYQEKIYLTLCKFASICHEHNITYFLFQDTAFFANKLHAFFEGQFQVNVVMPIEEYEKFKALGSLRGSDSDYVLESSYINSKYPYLYSRFVDKRTLFLNPQLLKNITNPGLGINIYRLIPYPTDKFKQLYLRFFKEGWEPSFGLSNYKLTNRKKAAFKLFKILRMLLGSIFAKYVNKLGTSNYETNYYYLEGYNNKCILFPTELFKIKTEYLFENNFFYLPLNVDIYLSIIYKNYFNENFRVSAIQMDPRIIVSGQISYSSYLSNLKLSKSYLYYKKCLKKISTPSLKVVRHRKYISLSRNKFLRTGDYFKLVDMYCGQKAEIIKAWEEMDMISLLQLFEPYVSIVKFYKKINLPIGYDKELYIILIKFLILQNQLDLSCYMIKKRHIVFNFITKMENINM